LCLLFQAIGILGLLNKLLDIYTYSAPN
uniref:Uncharacterized protein LOC104234011 n=1 Tax=Nicotiana sylvestris TaxID=4096 RepID=A0A1U7X4L3_NICSY